MKKVLWMLVAVLGFGVGTMAKEKTASGEQSGQPMPVSGTRTTVYYYYSSLADVVPTAASVSGTIKVDGETIKIVTDDKTEYILAVKAAAEYKAKDGEKVTNLKGLCKVDKTGKKYLLLASREHGKKKDANAKAPVTDGDKK